MSNNLFPTTPEEAKDWKPKVFQYALSSKCLLVAVTRIEGSWSCYCVNVPGLDHTKEKHLWSTYGTKVNRVIARAAFPVFDDIEYDY